MQTPAFKTLHTLVLGVIIGAVGLTAPALADAYKDRVNAAFKGVADDKRTDKILLPLLAQALVLGLEDRR